jgi:hypothetical protein
MAQGNRAGREWDHASAAKSAHIVFPTPSIDITSRITDVCRVGSNSRFANMFYIGDRVVAVILSRRCRGLLPWAAFPLQAIGDCIALV